MVSKVGFDLGVQGTWFREYGVHGFESTSYMVSAVLAYRVYSFSLPIPSNRARYLSRKRGKSSN